MKLASLIYGAGVALLLTQATAMGQQPPGPPVFPGPKVVDAKPGDVRVYVTAAIYEPLRAVTEQAKKAIGKNIIFEYGSARGNITDMIMAGNGDFELAMVLPDVNEKLLAADKIKPDTFEIARTPIAFGLRGDATVDVSTPDAVKKTLLAATSVKYAPTGAALFTAKKVLADLQIGDKVKDNSKTREEVVLTGNQYEINIYPLSEIITMKHLKNLGPVIKELQVPAVIEATIGKNTRDEASARALIKFLQGPAIDSHLKQNGFEKGKAVASK